MRRLFVAPLILMLVACGGTAPSVPPTASPSIPTATAQPPATSTVLPATPTPRPLVAKPTPPGLTCGTVEVRDNRVINPTDAQVAETCLWQTYQQCLTGSGYTMVVRDTTGETPFPNQSGFTSGYTEHYFMFITDGGEICKIDIQAGGGTYERNLAGTFGPDHGVHPVDHTICTYMTRSADGGLHLGGCTGVRTTYDIPHP